MTTPSLFETCPVPGCKNPVGDPREPCESCQTAFGDMIRAGVVIAVPVEEFTETLRQAEARVAVELAERAQMVPAAEPEVERKLGQRCWVCGERRKCRRDADHPDRWICIVCEAMT